MASWTQTLKGLFGGKPRQAKSSAKSPYARTAGKIDTSDRLTLIKRAKKLHAQNKGQVRDVLSRKLVGLQKHAPSTVDPGDLEDLMALYRAHVDIKKLLIHPLRRHLFLAGLRGLMQEGAEEPRKPAGKASTRAKKPRKTVARR